MGVVSWTNINVRISQNTCFWRIRPTCENIVQKKKRFTVRAHTITGEMAVRTQEWIRYDQSKKEENLYHTDTKCE